MYFGCTDFFLQGSKARYPESGINMGKCFLVLLFLQGDGEGKRKKLKQSAQKSEQ